MELVNGGTFPHPSAQFAILNVGILQELAPLVALSEWFLGLTLHGRHHQT